MVCIATVIFYYSNLPDRPGEIFIKGDYNESGVPTPTQKMYTCHPEEFPDIPIIKEYGNESNKIYYDEETWNAIGSAVAPYFTNNSRYWAYNGGIITGWGPDYCVGGISVCLEPEKPVNETMMDEIYSVFSESAKVQGMDEPYLIFIPVSAVHSD
jgi:hypothetical protein